VENIGCCLTDSPSRRLFGKHLLSLGGLSLMTGCALTDGPAAEKMLMGISKWNDKVQAFLFDPTKLVQTYPESMITKPFPFNAYYNEDEIRDVNRASYKLVLSGPIRDKRPWSLEQLSRLPQNSQVTRHICVEGWSAIGK
jgi:DMSO/TMAO reductase YedYZ molybdopterin-dependent catalytic subunit